MWMKQILIYSLYFAKVVSSQKQAGLPLEEPQWDFPGPRALSNHYIKFDTKK